MADQEDSDDEFDFDFVDAASKKVQSKWEKNFHKDTSDKTPSQRSGSEPVRSEEVEEAEVPAARAGKENCLRAAAREEAAAASDVSLTPPASPTGTTPRGAKKVRGANRTAKTRLALETLSKTVVSSVKRGRRSLEGGVVEEGGEVSSGEEEDTVEVKVRWKTKVVRVVVGRGERAGRMMDRVAEMVGLVAGEVVVYRGEEAIGREEVVGGLGLTVTSVLQGRARVVVEGEVEQGGLELRLQTKDRRSKPVLVTIQPTDKMRVVVEKYMKQTGVARDKLRIELDGEELEEEETAEGLELEGGECLDVHLLP